MYSLDFWRDQLKEAQSILGDKKMEVVSAARIPPGMDVEDVAKALKTLQEEGYFDYVGASEVSAASVEKMNKVCPAPQTPLLPILPLFWEKV